MCCRVEPCVQETPRRGQYWVQKVKISRYESMDVDVMARTGRSLPLPLPLPDAVQFCIYLHNYSASYTNNVGPVVKALCY